MRKLRLTPEEVGKYVEQFQSMLQRGTSALGKIKLEFDVGKIDKPPEKARVVFTPIAWLKMTELVKEFSSEVAWHFLVDRDKSDPLTFRLYDVLVYPQTVTGANVEMDEVTYGQWLMGIDDEVFNHIRGQGHSHVNMGVFASGTDMDHQNKIVSQLTAESENPFYVFIIINKKGDISFDVYDIKNNVVYEDKDVRYYIHDDGNDIVKFLDDAKELVKKREVKKTAVPAKAKAKTIQACLDVCDNDGWGDWRGSLY